MGFHYSLDLCFWDSRFVVCERGLVQAAFSVGWMFTPWLSLLPPWKSVSSGMGILSVKVLSLHGQDE